jgi:uncharacterized glyoxalase superfamily protein PhnB
MPSLEALKKQAKQYLRWHKDGYYPLAATIREALPRYKDLSDRQILDAAFKLNDAQELIARRHGFETWQALKQGLAQMTESAPVAQTEFNILTAKPQLWVRDLQVALEFYADKLGFKQTILYGDPPFYAHVERDGATFIFRCIDRPIIDANLRDSETLLAAEMSCADVKGLFEEYRNAGVPMVRGLKREPWGARNFIIRDPDGNMLLFAGN